MIHPERRRTWDVLTLLLVVYTALWIPFVVAFAPRVPSGTILLDIAVDLLFMSDIVLNMFTAFQDKRTRALVTDRRLIARQYLLGWFVVDFVSAIPLDLILLAISPIDTATALSQGEADSSDAASEQLQLFQLLKVVRLARLHRIVSAVSGVRFINVVSIVRLYGAILLIAHWGACVWYAIAVAQKPSRQGVTWARTAHIDGWQGVAEANLGKQAGAWLATS